MAGGIIQWSGLGGFRFTVDKLASLTSSYYAIIAILTKGPYMTSNIPFESSGGLCAIAPRPLAEHQLKFHVTLKAAPVFVAPGVVSVCAWCYPGQSIFSAHPDLQNAGVTITHGICKDCVERQLAAIRQQKQT